MFPKLRDILKLCAALACITSIIFLMVLLHTIVVTFKCPCRNDQNTVQIMSIFSGPAFLLFVIMFHVLRPLRYGWFHCPKGVEDDTRKSYPAALIICLIPPVIWIFLLLLNGNPVACAMTDWKGDFVFDEEFKGLWCKPTEGMRNQTELRDLTRTYILHSQYLGCVLIIFFSALSLAVVGIYDSCISGKCDRCPSLLLLFCGRNEIPGGYRQDDVELTPTSSSTTHPLINLSKKD